MHLIPLLAKRDCQSVLKALVCHICICTLSVKEEIACLIGMVDELINVFQQLCYLLIDDLEKFLQLID